MTRKQFNVRMDTETLRTMDRLGRMLGMPKRADVIRYAIARLAKVELKEKHAQAAR